MKIIFGESRDAIAEHAKKMLEETSKHDFNGHAPKPKGIAHYSATHPIVCDDCGETYWSRDPYASHSRCKAGRNNMGFS